MPGGNESAVFTPIAEPGQVQPSGNEETGSFAEDAQAVDVAALKAERDAALRRAATYEGNLSDLRQKYTANEQQQLALSKQLQDLQQKLQEREYVETVERLRQEGATETELSRYADLFKKEQEIQAKATLLEQLKPVIETTRAEQERSEYLKFAVGKANGLLESKKLNIRLTPEEVAAKFTKPPRYQGEVEQVIQELVLEKVTAAALAGRKKTLDERAKDGIDKQVPQGNPAPASIAEAEKAYREKRMSTKDFHAWVTRAKQDGVNGY